MEPITTLDNRNVIMPFMNSLLILYPWFFKCAMAITYIKEKKMPSSFQYELNAKI